VERECLGVIGVTEPGAAKHEAFEEEKRCKMQQAWDLDVLWKVSVFWITCATRALGDGYHVGL
jgi:hypothetical protein